MSFSQIGGFISRNKQQLINTIGMGIVFSYSIHNYRLKIAWDEHEQEMRAIESESIRVKDLLADKTWQMQASERIRRRKSTLEQELVKILETPREPSPIEKVQQQKRELEAIKKELGIKLDTTGKGEGTGEGPKML
jgi:hypothetical protein